MIVDWSSIVHNNNNNIQRKLIFFYFGIKTHIILWQLIGQHEKAGKFTLI